MHLSCPWLRVWWWRRRNRLCPFLCLICITLRPAAPLVHAPLSSALSLTTKCHTTAALTDENLTSPRQLCRTASLGMPAAYKWCLISLHHTVDHEYVWRTVFIHECFCFMVSGIFLDDSVWCYCVCVVWIVAMCYHGWCQWVWWCWKRYVQMNRINFWGS